MQQTNEGARQEPRSDQQNHRKSDFGNRQEATQPEAAVAGRSGFPALLKRFTRTP